MVHTAVGLASIPVVTLINWFRDKYEQLLRVKDGAASDRTGRGSGYFFRLHSFVGALDTAGVRGELLICTSMAT